MILMTMTVINVKNFVTLQVKLMSIKMEKFHAMKCVHMLINVLSLFLDLIHI